MKEFNTKYSPKFTNIHNIKVGDELIKYSYKFNSIENIEEIIKEEFKVINIGNISFCNYITTENEKFTENISYNNIRNWEKRNYYGVFFYAADIILKKEDNFNDYLPDIKNKFYNDIKNKINLLNNSLEKLKETKYYTDSREILEKIYNDYHSNDVELNADFFDFYVRMPERILLEIYAEVQKTINDDDIVKLNKTKLYEDFYGTENIIYGTLGQRVSNCYYLYENDEAIYEGNYKDFLKSFNGKENETGIYRLYDMDTCGDIVIGKKTDFIL